MTRTQVGLAALAVGLSLAGCGPVESTPAAGGGGGGASSPGTVPATSPPDDEVAASPDTSTGGGRWCEAVKALSASIEPLLVHEAVDKADVDRARAALKELEAAAPAEISTQVKAYSEFGTAVIDTRGKNIVEDPAAYERLGSTLEKLETAMPPVSDYTVKQCPGLDKPLPVEPS